MARGHRWSGNHRRPNSFFTENKSQKLKLNDNINFSDITSENWAPYIPAVIGLWIVLSLPHARNLFLMGTGDIAMSDRLHVGFFSVVISNQ